MLSGTTAFVTGASQGLGREIARTLADHGANVALAARNEDGLAETASEIPDDRVLSVPTDVTVEESVAAAVEVTAEEFGGLDCLVNNAGVAGPTTPVEEVTAEEWLRVQDVNVLGPFLCAKHAASYLRESDRGSLVTISSIAGKRPYPLRTPYAASKMAVVGLTRALAFELGDDDVTVNAVCPGAVEGDRIRRVFEARTEREGISPEEAAQRQILDDLPIEELVPPAEVAELVAYLASPHARHVTAQDINVDAGATWY
ncbi:SDR family NAD(P)-dependent oxidoreductase [Halomarina ordinaria]|uniref:SDR family NAD(P)-dependent oxidoreductase n=1 Tax=Halomarina ordinaria TaxID=3033939 RepID=A0ABD5U3M6_9EURY|nr:SDR family NAD(P)-dependent oxidoreductase [Halomarina sp. PSRA2]